MLVQAHQQTGLERPAFRASPGALALIRSIPGVGEKLDNGSDGALSLWLRDHFQRRCIDLRKSESELDAVTLEIGLNLSTDALSGEAGDSTQPDDEKSKLSKFLSVRTLAAREALLSSKYGVKKEAILNALQREAEFLAEKSQDTSYSYGNTSQNMADAELFIALVRSLGTKTKAVCDEIESACRRANFGVTIISPGAGLLVIERALRLDSPSSRTPRWEYYTRRMDAGDRAREIDEGLVAALALNDVRKRRATPLSSPEDGHVFIFDSLMHEAEVEVLRQAYGDALILISIHEPEVSRRATLLEDFEDDYAARNHGGKPSKRTRKTIETAIDELIARDDGTTRLTDTQLSMRRVFHLSDYSITVTRSGDKKKTTAEIPNQVERLFRCVFSDPFIVPTPEETGFAIASIASLSTTTLGRRVGACLMDKLGSVVGVGVNEVPKPEGGLYGEAGESETDYRDHRFVRDPYGQGGEPRSEEQGIDTNTDMRQELVEGMLDRVAEHLGLPGDRLRNEELERELATDIIEYGRAVHAEMSAILMALRSGNSLIGSTMYCTTLPCHACARHIIAAGIGRVVYSEPYPKSKLWELHPDAIIDVSKFGRPKDGDSRVAFEPFRGVSPSQLAKFMSWVERKQANPVVPATRAANKRESSLATADQKRRATRAGRAVKWDVKDGPFSVREGFLPAQPDMRNLYLLSVESREAKLVQRFVKNAGEQGVELRL
jgi:cytidine deaminase